MDASTGAVITGYTAITGLPYDKLRESVWVAFAWDLARLPDLAGKQASFYRMLMRREDHPNCRVGSWPVMVFPDGSEVLPSTVLDPGIGAWILSFFCRHVQCLKEKDRLDFLTSCWVTVEQAMDFLVSWVDARNREPLAGFDERRWRDGMDDMTLLEHYMGVDAGIRIASALNKAPDKAWIERKRELDALIRFHCVAKGGQWASPAVLPFWQDEFRETELPSWDDVIKGRILLLNDGGVPTDRDICEAALTFRADPGNLNALKPLIQESESQGNGNAYAAALHFIAIATIYGETK